MRLGNHLAIIAALCFIWVLGGCTADEGQPFPAGVRATELPEASSEGAQLTAQYCSQCHGIPSPTSHSSADWVPTVRRMVRYMEYSAQMGGMMGRHMMRRMPRGMHGAQVPSIQEQRAILGYLESYALRVLPEEHLPESGDPAAALFAQTCSRCHALPDPTQHTPAQWPAVVQRMLQHMNEQQLRASTPEEAQQVVEYLQRVSARKGS